VAKEAKKKSEQSKSTPVQYSTGPWLSMRTGLTAVILVSVGMAVLTAYTTVPALGWLEGMLWAVGFGAGVWLAFVLFFLFSRWARRKQD
jgi:sterol desaturase/sphingolipid hydroxylase (fatty acid hydroxylase superfamily)